MEFLKKFNLEPIKILKIVGLALIVVIVLVLGLRLFGSSVGSLISKNRAGNSVSQDAFSGVYYATDEVGYEKGEMTLGISPRPTTSPSVSSLDNGGTVGDNAEEFEVTEYSAGIETRNLEKTCDDVAALKSRSDVIFENASESDRYCNYGFKVKKESVPEILSIIKSLDPKDINENTYTIKRQIDEYTNETDILKKKMVSIDETLKNAVAAYDNITRLATNTQNVESLAKIIDSKINIIERLTQERININTQLDRLERAKATQLDRLDYTYFNVNVSENKFVNWEDLGDSWKASVRSFVRDINEVVQDVSINLVSLIFVILQYVLYFFIILVVVKYVWQFAKRIWTK